MSATSGQTSSSVPSELQARIKRAALLVTGTGLITLLTLVILLAVSGDSPKPYTYPNQWGFQSALIWFELANSPTEVFEILGPAESEKGKHIRGVMDAGNYADFAFMTAYSFFNATMLMFLHLLNVYFKRPLFSAAWLVNLGLFMFPLMLIGDIVETSYLLKLTEAKSVGDIASGDITVLFVATRIKWAALFVVCLLMGGLYAGYGGFGATLIPALVFLIGGMLGFMSILTAEGRALAEIASLLMGIGWIWTLVHGGLVVYKNKVPGG